MRTRAESSLKRERDLIPDLEINGFEKRVDGSEGVCKETEELL